MDEPDEGRMVAAAAGRHGFSVEAAKALAAALKRSGGALAQFDHADLGGMGQYTRGGMLMIGDMFNEALRTRVRGLADELVAKLDFTGETSSPPATQGGAWWPRDLGEPAASGGQNGIRYAVFPRHRRLAVERGGTVTVHDTLNHVITGVAQQGGAETTPRFADAEGTVDLARLPVVS